MKLFLANTDTHQLYIEPRESEQKVLVSNYQIFDKNTLEDDAVTLEFSKSVFINAFKENADKYVIAENGQELVFKILNQDSFSLSLGNRHISFSMPSIVFDIEIIKNLFIN